MVAVTVIVKLRNVRPVRAGTLVVLLLWGGASAAQEVEVEAGPPEFYAAHDRLQEYGVVALQSSPSLREAFARYQAALEKIPQVDALPEPTLTFTQALRSVETRVGPQRNTLMLSQSFPWFGKLSLRGQVAAQEALVQWQLYRAAQREIILQLKRAFYELAYVDAATRIVLEEQSLLEHYESLAQTRYTTGQGLQQAVIKVQSEITRVLSRLDLLAQQRASLEARLNTLMDRPPSEPIAPIGPLRVPELSFELESLYELGEENRQELKAAEERIERSERAIDLAKKSYWPDFFVGAGFINVAARSDPAAIMAPPPDNGKNALNVSAGIQIPIWRDKYDAAVREASSMLVAERSGYENVRNEMEFSIRDQVVRVETLQGQIRLFTDVWIPQAEETLRSTEAAYETGQLGTLDLLDSERMLLTVRLANARNHADLLQALASLERAVGTRFPR